MKRGVQFAVFLLALLLLLPAKAEVEPPQLRSINWRIEHADLVLAARVDAVRPTNMYTFRGQTRYRDLLIDLTVDTVFYGTLEHDFLSLVIKRVASQSGGYLYVGPPLAEYRVGRRYLVFLQRKLPAVYQPLDPLKLTEIELSGQPVGAPLSDDRSRRQAIASELMNRARSIHENEINQELVASIVELLGADADVYLRELLQHPQPRFRLRAAEWLDRLGLPFDSLVLLEILGESSYSPWVRAGAARLLGTRHSSEARLLLEQVALSAEQLDLQEAALYGLRELCDPQSARSLLPLLTHPDERIRYMAAGVLLNAASGTLIGIETYRAQEGTIIADLKAWAAGGASPDVQKYLRP